MNDSIINYIKNLLNSKFILVILVILLNYLRIFMAFAFFKSLKRKYISSKYDSFNVENMYVILVLFFDVLMLL